MKIRKGFVSNSSSSSFVVISKEPLSTIKRREENSRNSKYIFVDTAGASYSRSDIALCRSLEDKIRHFAVLYAIYYEEDKDYFVKMDRFQSKIEALGEKYGYKITIACPPLSGYVSSSSWDTQEDPKVVTFIDIPNECNYAEEVARIIENEDTTELESYLFNPHSFCVLGGNEYSETFKLAYKMRKFVDKKKDISTESSGILQRIMKRETRVLGMQMRCGGLLIIGELISLKSAYQTGFPRYAECKCREKLGTTDGK